MQCYKYESGSRTFVINWFAGSFTTTYVTTFFIYGHKNVYVGPGSIHNNY
jgi:hypothetical protein